jgi:CheY-like chemotaxis protein
MQETPDLGATFYIKDRYQPQYLRRAYAQTKIAMAATVQTIHKVKTMLRICFQSEVPSKRRFSKGGQRMAHERTNRVVLVVEDDPEIQSHMKRMINGKGHHALSAISAREAIQIAEQYHPAMILTDLQLPTLRELLELIRGHGTLNRLVVAIIDMNGPDLHGMENLEVLTDFEHLDAFVSGLVPSRS